MKTHNDNDNQHDHHHFHHFHHHHPTPPTKQHTTQPTRVNGIPLTNPNTLIKNLWASFGHGFLSEIRNLELAATFQGQFFGSKAERWKISSWKSHCQQYVWPFTISKWNYVKCSDVLQYHMMAKKKSILWHSAWFNNMLQWTCSHVRDTCCSPSRSVYRDSYIISFIILYIQYIYILIVATGSQCTKKNTEIPAFIEPITKKQNRAENTFGTMKKMITYDLSRSCWILPTWKKLDTLLQHMYLHASWRRGILWMYALI